MGEDVSQLQHSLQAASLAVEHGADEPTILAALLHDIGRFIPEAASLPKLIAPRRLGLWH
jgi:predicted HD phosphohydrolase